jgi:hypothetical protein
MRFQNALRTVLIAVLLMLAPVLKADGDPAKETPTSGRIVPIHLGQVDADT